jgi:hypothetical protein
MRVLLDAHHADLLESLHLLFVDRFGWDCYIPVGMDWWERGVWQFGRDTWGDDRLARQFLTREAVEVDSAHPQRRHNVLTLEEASDLGWDYVVASVPDNYAGYARFARDNGARFVIQAGNTNQWIDWSLGPLVLNSSEMPLHGRGVTYHQEFDLTVFYPTPAVSRRVGSFVNCMDRMPCWSFLSEARSLTDREFRVHGIDGEHGNVKPTSSVATAMRSCGWIWHDKVTGDGFGHVIHNAAAVGRPLIGHAGHYAGKMAEGLWEDGVTCIDLDRHTVAEAVRLMDEWDVTEMGHNIRARFDALVDYDSEAEMIRDLLG